MNKQMIYDMINGFMNCDALLLPENVWVKDEFAIGSEFDCLAEKIYQAKLNIGEKLDNPEDEDLEELSNCMNELMRLVALKMYDYGEQVARQQNAQDKK